MNTFRKDSILKKVLSHKASHFGVSDFETVIRHEEKMLLYCESSQKLSQSKTESELHQFLNILFSSKLSGEEKVRLLDEELDIAVDEKIREELNDMCNLSEGIEEKGMKKGIETGRLETIAECLRNGTMNDAKRLLKATGEEIEKATELFLKKGE